MKVNITIDDIRLKSNSITNKAIRSTKGSFFYIFLGFTYSHSEVLGDTPGFVQLIPGGYKIDKLINITGIDKIHSKCDCFQGSKVNRVRETILYKFT